MEPLFGKESVRRYKNRSKAKGVAVSLAFHAMLFAMAAGITIYALVVERDNNVLIQRTQSVVAYDDTPQRSFVRTPKVICDKLVERPVIVLESETEVTRDIPRGTSFDNLSNRNLNSTSCVDAYGIGGGAAGAYSSRWGRGSFVNQGGSAGTASSSGKSRNQLVNTTSKTTKRKWVIEPADNSNSSRRNKRKWVVTPRKDRGNNGQLVNVPDYSADKKTAEKKNDEMTTKRDAPNPFVSAKEQRLSTFAVDVDTASFSIARRYLASGQFPPEGAVRVEEVVNYLDYGYETPGEGKFAIHLEAAPSKFSGDPERKLLRVALKAEDVHPADRKDTALTFVIDVSGSMNSSNRLPLVKRSLRLLLNQLRPSDTVAIVVYGSDARTVMEPLSIDHQVAIERAIDGLKSEGATNAEAGLLMGYKTAAENFREGAVNRVILCSDGVANIGETGPDGILKKVDDYAKKGIYLSTVGFGMGHYNDTLMEQLADKGDGNYAYVDDIKEARRVFVNNLNGTLQAVAKDVKVQVAFDAKVVERFRLVGYENRHVDNKDFRNDAVDAGEVGAGHSVTALYELDLTDEYSPGDELAEVTIRYKDPDNVKKVSEQKKAVTVGDAHSYFDYASREFRLAATAAQFAEILRRSPHAEGADLKPVVEAAGELLLDMYGNETVEEFHALVNKAAEITAAKKKETASAGR